MFFETMMDYVNDYFIVPMFSWLNTEFGVNTYFGIVDGQVYFNQVNNVVVVNGNDYNLLSLDYLLSFVISVIITALLLYAIVKFIIWLFKQIAFITRF